MIQHQNDNNHGAIDGPVTVIVTRKAKKGKIREFEEWMDGIIHEAMNFEGHTGVSVIRPAAISNPEYIIIFRFNTYENLARWEYSETRNEWLEKSKDVTEGEPRVEKQSGLEFWFTPRPGAAVSGDGKNAPAAAMPPPRYKMAMVVTSIIFVLVSTLLPQIREATVGLPTLLSTLIGVAIMVLLMTYVIMPSVTRLLRLWLSKKRFF